MGFEMGPIGNKPIIRENQGTQDGGAGNLGYMRGVSQEDEKTKHQNALDKSIFGENATDESTQIIDDESVSEDYLTKFFTKIVEFFKNLIKKLLNK